MSFREVPFTKNRVVIADLMARARRFHMPVSATAEYDASRLMALLEANKRTTGLAAAMTVATARLIDKDRRLNRHIFTDALGRKREVEFDDVRATVVIQRRSQGENILLPMVLPRAHERTVDEVHQIIKEHKRKPLRELPLFQALERVKRAPLLALKWFDFKARSDPEFYLKHFGTYGVSCLSVPEGSGTSLATVANTTVSFFPGTIRDRAVVVRGEIVVRKVLTMGFVFDHYVVDGLKMTRTIEALRTLIEQPDWLFSAQTPNSADAQAAE